MTRMKSGESQYTVCIKLLKKLGIHPSEIASLGITNQRETTVVWDKSTGKPVYNAIVWQDKRTSDFCNQLKNKGLEENIRSKTGLVIDSYFSATKIHWILNNVEGAKKKRKKGNFFLEQLIHG
jgi:glycerol kinase